MSEMFLISRTADFPRHQWPLLHGNYIVGRSRDCDIVLFDETVSREHATVMVDNNVVKVTDCGSRNGTHVGDHRLAVEEVVAIGTTVRFGRIECLLVDSHMLQAFEESGNDRLANGRNEIFVE